MKVYYWGPYMGNVGTIKGAIDSAAAMKALGYEVKLYKVYREWEGYEDVLERYGLEVVDFGLSKKIKKLPERKVGFRISMAIMSLYSYRCLQKNWNEEKPDVIIATLLGYLPLLVRKHSGHKPKIINSIQGRPRLNSIRKFVWKMLYAKSDRIVTLSDNTEEMLLRTFPFMKDKIVRINNPIIDERLAEMEVEPMEEWELETYQPYIIGVGRLTRQKDFKTLIRAYSILRQEEEFKKYKLLILGVGEERKKLEALVKELGISESVFWGGFVKNPYKYMVHSEVFVLSSLWEDAGHVLLEAAYLKVPIVSTRCPSGQEEFLDYGEGGELCEVENPKDMAQHIKLVLTRKNDNKILHAYEKVQPYTMEMHGHNLDLLLKELCEG